LRVAL
jgi:hypothetical protein